MTGQHVVTALLGWTLIGTVLAVVLSVRLISKFAASARTLPDDAGIEIRQQRARELSHQIAPRRVLVSALASLAAAIAMALST
ncbi:hypothetical protein [Streptomyces sp. NPDC048643]|uniref:hypothetical protein n=1 Tax=Streptomyces sp. NPDC048643 TaxID=3155637 RepID=UPI00341AD0AE